MLSPHQVAAAKNQDGLLACLVVEGLKIRVRSEGMLKALALVFGIVRGPGGLFSGHGQPSGLASISSLRA
jgi:hypothetical protein